MAAAGAQPAGAPAPVHAAVPTLSSRWPGRVVWDTSASGALGGVGWRCGEQRGLDCAPPPFCRGGGRWRRPRRQAPCVSPRAAGLPPLQPVQAASQCAVGARQGLPEPFCAGSVGGRLWRYTIARCSNAAQQQERSIPLEAAWCLSCFALQVSLASRVCSTAQHQQFTPARPAPASPRSTGVGMARLVVKWLLGPPCVPPDTWLTLALCQRGHGRRVAAGAVDP